MGQEHFSIRRSSTEKSLDSKAGCESRLSDQLNISYNNRSHAERNSGQKQSCEGVPSMKKVKGHSSTLTSQVHKQARERLLSCPDHLHHTEQELTQRLATILSQKVERVNETDLERIGDHALATSMRIFDGMAPPAISLGDYIQRLIFYLTSIAEQERAVGLDSDVHSDLAIRYLVTAIIYLERIQARTGMHIHELNVHRLLITGTVIAAKVLDDVHPNHKYFSDLGGLHPSELTRMEFAFLTLCDYNVNVDPEQFALKYALTLE